MMIEKYNRLAIVNKKYGKLTVGLGQWTSLRRSAATDYCARFADKKNPVTVNCIKFYCLCDTIDKLHFTCPQCSFISLR